ncbi:P4HA1-like protein [Mya arenaria]|uniref:P4HA1-like protein n=1 Tax=Mya arenaria TaxID=6604 RepID=A0ABY7FSC2_MYAAR|nr:P4HA1-like protein [Mya arenaria]
MVKALWNKTEDSRRGQVYRRMNTPIVKADLKNRHDRLCNGQSIENLLPNRHPPWRHLVCRTVDNGSPILRFQPIKLEERSLDPYVAIFHDVGSQHDIETVKEYAKPKLQRSTVSSLKGSVPDPGRTSQGMFIYDDSKYIKFAKRIEAATGLNYRGYEKFQIANYGVGGHYYCHHDFFASEYARNSQNGDNRIATFMMYLTDVVKGGATVFPDIDVSVFPKKGTAIFWYNMFRNGTVNMLTRHAACPVLVGEKHDRLCNGQSIENLLPNRHPPWRHLVCRTVVNGSPILRFQPIKLEERSLDPYVAIFHDVGSQHDIETVKEYAKPKLQRSRVRSLKGSVPDPGRTSQGMFIYDDSKYIKFAKRIEAATGLNYRGYEKFQIANYGVGGHYYCHHDFFASEYARNSHNGDNRIATFMMYLTDVVKGGATVFPDIDVSVFPKKGTAIFWYNMFRNGTVNMLTRHAACPVLVGEKWVGNLWIRRNAQIFNKPCGLDRLELDWTSFY